MLLRLTGIVAGQGADADIAALDDFVASQIVEREVRGKGSRVAGRDPAEIMAALAAAARPRASAGLPAAHRPLWRWLRRAIPTA